MKLIRIVVTCVAVLLLPVVAVASPATTMPLPAAARQAILAAREAKSHALAAYRLACRQADRKEFLALKLAEKAAMRAGNLKQAEAAELHAKHVQARFAKTNKLVGVVWREPRGFEIIFSPNGQVHQAGHAKKLGQWYQVEGLTGGYVVTYKSPVRIDLMMGLGNGQFVDFDIAHKTAWVDTRSKN